MKTEGTSMSDKSKRININKLLVHKDTMLGSRLWQLGKYYKVVDFGGKGVGEHWVCEEDENQQP